MHMLYLTRVNSHSVHHYIYLLKETLRSHFSESSSTPTRSKSFPTRRLVITALLLTIGMALPGLLWYMAVSLASISSVTALWNTNAFWAYLLTVRILEEDSHLPSDSNVDENSTLNPSTRTIHHRGWWRRLEPAKLAAVGMACVGVIVVVYSGKDEDPNENPTTSTPSAPLAGILLTLLASILYALVQVLYKKYISLPQLPNDVPIIDDSPLVTYRRLSTGESETDNAMEEEAGHCSMDDEGLGPVGVNGESRELEGVNDPAVALPFGLYSNFMTSLVGLGTIILLWPLLLISPTQSGQLPSGNEGFPLIPSIIILGVSGLTFTTTYLILLSIWGPVLISVGNLLTIVLMLLVEFTIMDAPLPNLKAILGCGMIAGGFGVLLWSIRVHST